MKENLPDGVTREGGDDDQRPPSRPIPKPVKVDLPKNCTWSNDAADLALAAYFCPNKPNLSSDFDLDGLQPVIRDADGNVFLLMDGQGRFYQWYEHEGEMWRLEGITEVQEAVRQVMRDSGILKRVQVWNVSRLMYVM